MDSLTKSDPAAPQLLGTVAATTALLTGVETIPGAIGHAQTGDVASAPPGALQSVALNGFSGSFGNIGRLKRGQKRQRTKNYSDGTYGVFA